MLKKARFVLALTWEIPTDIGILRKVFPRNNSELLGSHRFKIRDETTGRRNSAFMNGQLAVITAEVGMSFIDRHIQDLVPGNTVVISRQSGHALGGQWKEPCPVMYLDRWALGLGVRVAKRLGARENALRNLAVGRFLRQHRVRVVLGEFLDQFLDFIPLLQRMNIPFVVQGHGIDVSAKLRVPELRAKYSAYQSARAVLTRSEFHRQRLLNVGIPKEKVHVNPGGVDVPAVAPVRGPKAARRFLSLGRLVVKKGPIYLLEAFRLAAARDSEIELDVIGNGALSPAVHQFVHACGLQDRIRLHGLASEALKSHLLSECGVFVQHCITDPDTGDEEGLPAATQEAMAHAMAVVSTRHAGIPEAVQHGQSGFLVDEGNARAMGEAMLAVINHAPKFGAAGRNKAERLYTWSAERSRLLSYLGPETA